MIFAPDVIFTDVAMRDGLQGQGIVLPTEAKLLFIEQLVVAGCSRIEVASFVNRTLVPTMADADELCSLLPRGPHVAYGGLVLDPKGMDRLLAAELDWAEIVTAPSSTFLMRNQRCDRAGSLARAAEIARMRAGTGIPITVYISCCIADPYEGPADPADVAELCDAMLQIGIDHVFLADTTGQGTPPSMRRLLDAVVRRVPLDRLGAHFHDSYGQAIANLDAALGYGVRRIDAAAGGLGGCIFAPGATGNVAAEDVLALLAGHELATGIDPLRLAEVGQALCDALGQPNGSNAGRALLRRCVAQ